MYKRYFIELSYNGAAYHGWQRQNNAFTVQEHIEQAMNKILRCDDTSVLGCGRTDTGVHAKKFYAHVDLHINEESDPNIEQLIYRMNQLLGKGIAIHDIFKVEERAHARFDATSRKYEYKVHFRKNPFLEFDSILLKQVPDMKRMNEAAKLLLGEQDFTSFAKLQNDAHTHICNITLAEWEGDEIEMKFTIVANRFLRNMVRAVVGTLLEVGYGKMTKAEFRTLIEAKDRREAGTSAKANGLSLCDIAYPYIQ